MNIVPADCLWSNPAYNHDCDDSIEGFICSCRQRWGDAYGRTAMFRSCPSCWSSTHRTHVLSCYTLLSASKVQKTCKVQRDVLCLPSTLRICPEVSYVMGASWFLHSVIEGTFYSNLAKLTLWVIIFLQVSSQLVIDQATSETFSKIYNCPRLCHWETSAMDFPTRIIRNQIA